MCASPSQAIRLREPGVCPLDGLLMGAFGVRATIALNVCPVWLHIPGASLIVEQRVQHDAKFFSQRSRLDRYEGFDPADQIARHAVCGTDVVLLLATVAEVVDARVLEEATDDADDANVLRQPGNSRA